MVAFGTVKAILNDTEALGIRTNAKSTNWYVQIGNMIIAGCQIHYAILVDREDVNFGSFQSTITHDGNLSYVQSPSNIYDADN